jgi:hypothetical protein
MLNEIPASYNGKNCWVMYYVEVKVADKLMRFNVNLFRGEPSDSNQFECELRPSVFGSGKPVDNEL